MLRFVFISSSVIWKTNSLVLGCLLDSIVEMRLFMTFSKFLSFISFFSKMEMASKASCRMNCFSFWLFSIIFWNTAWSICDWQSFETHSLRNSSAFLETLLLRLSVWWRTRVRIWSETFWTWLRTLKTSSAWKVTCQSSEEIWETAFEMRVSLSWIWDCSSGSD